MEHVGSSIAVAAGRYYTKLLYTYILYIRTCRQGLQSTSIYSTVTVDRLNMQTGINKA